MNILLMVLKALSGLLSAPLREFLRKAVLDWEAVAKKTASEFDDLLVGLLKALLGL